MKRREKMCSGCPFRGMSATEKREAALIDPVGWPCHEEGGYFGWSEIQCRGHFEACRKYPRSEADKDRFAKWQDDFNVAFGAGVTVDSLPVFVDSTPEDSEVTP